MFRCFPALSWEAMRLFGHRTAELPHRSVIARSLPAPLHAGVAGDLRYFARIGEIDRTIIFFDRKPPERLSEARAAQAFAGCERKARAVAGADHLRLVRGEKMVGERFQRNELVRATIDIGV